MKRYRRKKHEINRWTIIVPTENLQQELEGADSWFLLPAQFDTLSKTIKTKGDFQGHTDVSLEDMAGVDEPLVDRLEYKFKRLGWLTYNREYRRPWVA